VRSPPPDLSGKPHAKLAQTAWGISRFQLTGKRGKTERATTTNNVVPSRLPNYGANDNPLPQALPIEE